MHYTASSIYEFKVLKAHTAAAVLTRIFYRYTGIWRLIFFVFVLIILYSLYLEYDSPLVPSASGLAG